jgi:hypothetical protein
MRAPIGNGDEKNPGSIMDKEKKDLAKMVLRA